MTVMTVGSSGLPKAALLPCHNLVLTVLTVLTVVSSLCHPIQSCFPSSGDFLPQQTHTTTIRATSQSPESHAWYLVINLEPLDHLLPVINRYILDFSLPGVYGLVAMPVYSLQAVADFITIEAATLEEALHEAPLAILSNGLTIFADREYGAEEINELEKDKNWEPEMGSREWLIGKELEEWYKGNVLPSQN